MLDSPTLRCDLAEEPSSLDSISQRGGPIIHGFTVRQRPLSGFRVFGRRSFGGFRDSGVGRKEGIGMGNLSSPLSSRRRPFSGFKEEGERKSGIFAFSGQGLGTKEMGVGQRALERREEREAIQ
ncbi:unnamed protein product [Linum trigynum]|uniref:Uncharacterized protein n=1 Tax=Linum trigynum TaxID=586398 RepID=A0AAV2FQT1_9ROSI